MSQTLGRVSVAAAVALLSGCTTGRASLTGPHPSITVPASAGPAPVVDSVRQCNLHQLVAHFEWWSIGTGKDSAALVLHARSGPPCAMTSAITLVPLDTHGSPMRTHRPVVSRPASPPLVLDATPNARATSAEAILVVGLLESQQDGLPPCPASHAEVPTRWRVSAAGHHTVVDSQAIRTGHLQVSSCDGYFEAAPQEKVSDLPLSPPN